MTFHDNLDHHLHLASGELEGWVVETLDPAGDRGRWSSIGFTPDGTLHVAYSDELGQVRRHIWRSEHDGRDQDCDGVAW